MSGRLLDENRASKGALRVYLSQWTYFSSARRSANHDELAPPNRMHVAAAVGEGARNGAEAATGIGRRSFLCRVRFRLLPEWDEIDVPQRHDLLARARRPAAPPCQRVPLRQVAQHNHIGAEHLRRTERRSCGEGGTWGTGQRGGMRCDAAATAAAAVEAKRLQRRVQLLPLCRYGR